MKTKRMLLQNQEVKVCFDDEGRLASLAAANGNVGAPIDEKCLPHPFAIALRTEAGEIIEVTPQSPPGVTRDDHGDTQRLVLTWAVEGNWGQMAVRAIVELDAGSPLSRWTLEIENGTNLPIWEIAYPRVSGLGPFCGDGEQDYLAAPKGMGHLCFNPIALANRDESKLDSATRDEYGTLGMEPHKNALAFSYPGMWAMQYLPFGHPGVGGVYFAAHDSEALYKRFGMYGEGGRAALAVKQYPQDRTAPGANFCSFYPVMIGLYEGEWWDASEIYRQWALKQKWCANGPTKDRSDIPIWAKDLDLWYWNWQFAKDLVNHPKNLIPIIAYIKKRFGCEMAFHWYGCNGEHGITSPWRGPDIYPDNATIRRTLINAVNKLHEIGVRCIPYINPRLWCEDDDDFLAIDGMKWIAVDEHGRSADTWWGLGHTMCPTAKPAQEVMRRIYNRMVDEIGMDGAYFDQISSCFAVPCFNPNHDHGPGGHDHWCRGYRELLEKVQQDAKRRSPDLIITSESTIECYQDLLDLDLAREISNLRSKFNDPYALPIPMFHSVYHDYHMTYGTVSTFKPRGSEIFRIETFRYAESLCLVGGGQLMISGVFAGDEAREQYAAQFDYMETLTRAHVAARPFLNLGVWKPPLELECERVEIPWQDGLPLKRDIPAVLHGCFELDGELCVVFVNHTEAERAIRFRIDPARYALTDGPFELRLIHPTQKILATACTPPAKEQMTIAPLSAQVLLAKPSPPVRGPRTKAT